MLTDHYITSQKEIEEVTILICQGTDQILGHLEDHAFYNNGLLFLNEMVTALKGIEACLSINMDQQLIGEIHDLIYCYREIADYFQNKQNGDAEGDSAQLAFKTQEIVEKLRTAVFARKKSIMMLTGNLQQYALHDLMYAIQISKKMHAVRILDYALSLESLGIVEKEVECGEARISLSDFNIDGYNVDNRDCMPAFAKNIYNSVYQNGEVPTLTYDIVWLLHAYNGSNIEQIEKCIKDTNGLSRFVLLNVLEPVSDSLQNKVELIEKMEQYGKCIFFSNESEKFYLLDRNPVSYEGKVGMYVVTHKEFLPPEDAMYIPIHAGKKEKIDLGYQGDDQGDNISELNPYINELTALYWIWKHDNEHAYIGLNHYRRYFNWHGLPDTEALLDEETVLGVLKDYDVIISEPLFFYPISIEYQLREMFEHSRGIDEAFSITRKRIAQIQPEYEKYFNKVMEGHNFICCNIFIASREIVGAYCEWLFSFLPGAVDEWISLCMGDKQNEHPRAMGFMAERLFSVWLMGNGLKVKTLHGMATMKYCVPEKTE